MTRWRKLSICGYLRPKEKVGENPPDNASDDPSKLWIIREGWGGSKLGLGRVAVQVEVTIGIKRAIVMGRTQPSSDGFPEGLIDQRF